jgi:predicted nucleic acid-binding Zn ribbon protein
VVLYEYYCPECEGERIVKQSIHDDLPILFCDTCEGGPQMRQRLPWLSLLTCNSGRAINERAKKLARQDRKRISKGEDKALTDLVGDKVNSLKE